MTYFTTNYPRINYPIETKTSRGLRNAQIGAAHAIAAHFTLTKQEPALIVLPTGSGKTAVLNLAPYLLRASRVLVLSSSRTVRGQIVEEFRTLKTLKGSNVFHKDLACPNVREIQSPIKSTEEWEELAGFDVVVGIPNSINEGLSKGFDPPKALFDLILVDEAHHVPAFTWTNIVKTFDEAKKIYFTATPFRRDRKEIEGKLVYMYSITRAYEDGIFGEIGYYPVLTTSSNTDLAIALETEKIFLADQKSGLVHFVMVRTDSGDEAENLYHLYKENTCLRLKKVDSTLSYKTVKQTIEQLKNGELDGVICVDMLGEGFDFPNLKIAAIHSPKKSLAATLQFIGRFARTNADNIGQAKFIAIPSDIEIGKQRLYSEGSIWKNLIRNLSEDILAEEDMLKKVLDTFESDEEISPESKDISLYNLKPFSHVKIYYTDGIYLESSIEIPGHEIIYNAISSDHNTCFFISKETTRPRWIATDNILNINYYFFLIYFDKDTELLFIHSSIKTPKLYDHLVDFFAASEYKRVPKHKINKVLLGINNPEFFNIGMQNRSANSGESYRIIAGPNTENTIRKSHGKNYSNGHIFAKGKSGDGQITVGYSSGSKLWSNGYLKIPIFIEWCRLQAQKITSDVEVKTNTGFDNLPIGQSVDRFPLVAHSAIWNHRTFINPPILHEGSEESTTSSFNQLLDYSVVLNEEESSQDRLSIDLVLAGSTIPLSYDFEDYFSYRIEPEYDYIVEEGDHLISLIDYLNETPLQILLVDFATIADHEFFPPPNESDYQYPAEKIESIDWSHYNTDIQVEFYKNDKEKSSNGGKDSIQETLLKILLESHNDILIHDHGAGEIADYITFKEFPDKISITLYHVKGAGEEKPGNRVSDLYEVCMQVIKSQVWATNKQSFKSKVTRRTSHHEDKYIIGSLTEFSTLIDKGKRAEFTFSVVQPGVSKSSLSPKLSFTLAATDDTLINNGYEPLRIIGS